MSLSLIGRTILLMSLKIKLTLLVLFNFWYNFNLQHIREHSRWLVCFLRWAWPLRRLWSCFLPQDIEVHKRYCISMISLLLPCSDSGEAHISFFIGKLNLFFFFGGTGVWTQGFALVRQVLYHLSDTFIRSCSGYFGDKLSLFVLAGLDCDSPVLSFSPSL
jgi:hypothetical protein